MTETAIEPVQGEMTFPDAREIDLFANKFSSNLEVPLIIWLEGDLGAGKTTFARSLIHALGYKGRVKSPTYGLLEQYEVGSRQVIHMDLYRISDPGELEFLALEDLLDENSILLVEWPDKGDQWLPEPDFIFKFLYAEVGRNLRWSAYTSRAQVLMQGCAST